MIITPYVFAWESGGSVYSYPNDYTASIFRRVHKVEFNNDYDSVLIIERKGTAVFYIHICQLLGGGGIGLCVVTTSSYIPNLKALINNFDSIIKRMYLLSCFLVYDSVYGLSIAKDWYDLDIKGLDQIQAEKALGLIKAGVGKLNVTSDLPPISLDKDSSKVYYIDEKNLKSFDRSQLYSSGSWIITHNKNLSNNYCRRIIDHPHCCKLYVPWISHFSYRVVEDSNIYR